jgi:hypothetical protein
MLVASELALPELLPWRGSADFEPDLRLRYGIVPEQLEGAEYRGPVFQTKGDTYLLAIPGSARFLVTAGQLQLRRLPERENPRWPRRLQIVDLR